MRKIPVTLIGLIAVLGLVVPAAMGTTYYLDSSVASSGNGQSWTTAWKNFSNISGLNAGDTVMISGGSSGQTYNTGSFNAPSGKSGNPVIFQAACDSGHSGVITISGTGGNQFISGASWYTFTGNCNDGTRHIVINGWSTIINGDSDNGLTFSYVEFDGASGGQEMLHMNGTAGLTLDHVMLNAQSGADRAIQGGLSCGSSPGYTVNLIHDSTFQLRWGSTSGFGDDGVGGMECTSFYNNQVLGIHDPNYSWTQHQDGIQTGGQYIAIYNNYFNNLQNYPIYGDQVGGGTLQHWRIYNNIMYDPQTSEGNQGISIGCDGTSCTQNDIIVANNTLVSNVNCIYLNQGTSGTLTNSYVYNNICYNSGSTQISTAVSSNNVNSTSGIAFVSATSDWHETSASTATIGKGVSPSTLTSVFTTDKDGNPRPAGAWDIGAYQFSSGSGGGSTPPTPPSNLAAVVQ
ncbi:MAG TPA: hypothetical protein VMG82_02665 [Candidatus Sulfotelmatobacter sp.]|nr:hypothetical protein [Candidatus Sulfotelmatobacter sp.]